MFSNLKPDMAKSVFAKLMFGKPTAMKDLSQEAKSLNELANTFNQHFVTNMEGLNDILQQVLADRQFMELLNERKRNKFIQAVNDFQKTFQKLRDIKKMHGGTTIAKYEKILQRVTALRDIISKEQGVWHVLGSCIFIIEVKLSSIKNSLSCFEP